MAEANQAQGEAMWPLPVYLLLMMLFLQWRQPQPHAFGAVEGAGAPEVGQSPVIQLMAVMMQNDLPLLPLRQAIR